MAADLALVVGLWLAHPGRAAVGGPWMEEVDWPWIPQLGVRFHLAMDGLSLLMVSLAALLGRTQTGLIVAVVAPWLNWALTTHPTPRGGVVMTIQLLAFVLALHALVRGCGSRWFLAAPAYLASMAVASLAVGAFPALIGGRSVMPWVAQGVVTGLPGLAILVAINWLVVRTYPSDPRGGGPLAA